MFHFSPPACARGKHLAHKNEERMKTTEIPFPELLPDTEETLDDGGDIFRGNTKLQICYDLDLGSEGRPIIVAKKPGGKDKAKGKKEKPKGNTDAGRWRI